MNTLNRNDELDRLQGDLIDAKVDINIANERIRTLTGDLKKAHAKIRDYELSEHTVNGLRIVDYEDEGDTYNPRQPTGEYRAPWKGRVR
jgi:hypothetical protein